MGERNSWGYSPAHGVLRIHRWNTHITFRIYDFALHEHINVSFFSLSRNNMPTIGFRMNITIECLLDSDSRWTRPRIFKRTNNTHSLHLMKQFINILIRFHVCNFYILAVFSSFRTYYFTVQSGRSRHFMD